MIAFYHDSPSSQHPSGASPVPRRLPFRLRERIIPARLGTKRPWRYVEVGSDVVLPSQIGQTTEAMISHWQETLPPSQWLVRTGRIEDVDDGLSLVVLDVDYPSRSPAKPLGAWAVKTRRGVHWYTWTDATVKNDYPAWGEVKGDAGLVLAPGSRHPDNGQVYTPLDGFGELIDGQLPMLPPEYMPVTAHRLPVEHGIDSEIGKGLAGRIPPQVCAAKGERWLTLRSLLCRVAGSPSRRGDDALLASHRPPLQLALCPAHER